MEKQKFNKGDLVVIDSKWHPYNRKTGIYCSAGRTGFGNWILLFPHGSVYVPFTNSLRRMKEWQGENF
ncbi:MAG: hypothetical protein MRJ65_14185 [Candidatus Brocadiaceae bacterium]|nr:hypothetical protein [Candidatus Brocadiaceae bacterium]